MKWAKCLSLDCRWIEACSFSNWKRLEQSETTSCTSIQTVLHHLIWKRLGTSPISWKSFTPSDLPEAELGMVVRHEDSLRTPDDHLEDWVVEALSDRRGSA